jgi:hypothetical protein
MHSTIYGTAEALPQDRILTHGLKDAALSAQSMPSRSSEHGVTSSDESIGSVSGIWRQMNEEAAEKIWGWEYWQGLKPDIFSIVYGLTKVVP